jgi:phosphoadenosine phosphosulfate reductase
MSTGNTYADELGSQYADREFTKAGALADTWSSEEVLRWAFATYQPDIALASAFGPEGVVLIDLAAPICPNLRIFTLDTSFLFPETYQLAEQIEKRYQVRIEWVHPDLTPEQQSAVYGPDLWRRDPDQCCMMRKVDPLRRKVEELSAWVTAIRRDQTVARARARKIEWDPRFGLVKINPLVEWSSDQVWRYIRDHQIVYNPLHDRNFPSIGCTHCTRPVAPDEDSRAGRWSGMRKTECGLHERDNSDGRAQ